METLTALKRLPPLLCWLIFAAVVCEAQKPELVVQTGHPDWVRSVAFSPDGRLLASAGDDRTIKLWDVATGAQLRSLEGREARIFSVVFSPDGKTLASGSGNQIKLWDVASGAQLRLFGGHTTSVSSVAFSPDGKSLASGSFDGTLKLWDAATGQQLRAFDGRSYSVFSVSFAPDGKTLASGSDNTIKLWDVATGSQLHSFGGLTRFIWSVAFSPDGKTLASGGTDGTVRLWDVAARRQLLSLEEPGGAGLGAVFSVAFSPDGKLLASGGLDGTVKLRDAASGALLRSLDGHAARVFLVAFAPDGRTLASGSDDQTIKLWDAASGAQLRSLGGHSTAVSAVALSPDGRLLASGGEDETIRLWDATSGALLRTFAGHTSAVRAVAFSPDGRLLASGANDAAKLWDVATGSLRRSLDSKSVTSVAFSPDGKTLAGAAYDKVELWDVATGTRLKSLEKYLIFVNAIAFGPDGKTLASGCYSTVELWDVTTGTHLRSLGRWEPDGRKEVISVAFSPDGKTLASGSGDGRIELWDVAAGTQPRLLDGRSGRVSSVAFGPGGRLLATGGGVDEVHRQTGDNTIKLWEVATGKRLRLLEGHDNSVSSVAFSPDGRLLVSGGQDAKIKLWDVEGGRELAGLISLDEKDWLVVTPDGLFDGSPAAWGKMIWRAAQNTFDFVPVEAYFSDFYYPGLLSDIYAGKRPQAPTMIGDKDRRQPQVRIASAEPSDWSDPKMKEQGAARPYLHVVVEVTEAPVGGDHKRGSGARDVRLFRDGTLVKIWRGDVLGGRSSVRLVADVPVLPGENHFTAYAFNHDNIKSGDATFVAKGDPTGSRNAPPARTAYVLAVGVNRYANARFNLRYAVADARDFGAEWRRQQEALKHFQRVEVVLLLDEEATKANILRAVRRLVDLKPEPLPAGAPQQLARLRYAEPQDAVVLYFAGHGTAHGNRFYLIPHDLGYAGNRTEVTAAGLRSLLTHAISDLELEQAFEGLQSGQQAFVIDACNSGQALEAEEKRRGPMNSKGLAQLAYEKGMYILTAAQSFQAAQEASQLGHGLLTYALVDEGLKQGKADAEPRDGDVLMREWLDYATVRVPQMQIDEMKRAAARGIKLAFKEEERQLSVALRSPQVPRVFYRRELEPRPLVVAKTARPPN